MFKVRGENNSLVKGNHLLDKFYGFNLTKLKQKPIDLNENPIPWYTYPAIEFLEQFDFQEKNIFEWGSGNSSLYFCSKARKVISVEHDKEWFNFLNQQLKSNQQLNFAELDTYPNSIASFDKKFDVIIIDGQRRFDCVLACKPFIKENAMIILDNSDWFYHSAAYLRKELNLLQVDFHGFGPINDYTWTTSIFFTKDFNFPLNSKKQPKNPSGGILHDELEIIKKEDKLFNTTNYDLIQKLDRK